jgi:hypothetical protein
MKYLSTYEGLLSRLFINKYVKRIVSSFDKLLSMKHRWEYKDFSVVLHYKKTEFTHDLGHIAFLINYEHHDKNIYFILNSINKKYGEEFIYLEELLKEYGVLDDDTEISSPSFDVYNLQFVDFDKFISKLSVEDFETYKDLKKYNL